MEVSQKNEANRRASGSSSERIIFYVDDGAMETSREVSPHYGHRTDTCFPSYPPPSPNNLRMDERSLLFPSSPENTGFQMDDRSILYLASPEEAAPRASSVRSNASRHSRSEGSELEARSSRRSSSQAARPRANSCARPTPLGDGRRASTCRKTKPGRVSAARRKDSVRPARNEVRQARKVMEDARELEQARRHRRIAMIVLGTFLFLLTFSILAVVVTLTHSSFLSPALGSQELTEHRAQLRRENEELLNSLNREYVPENTTVPP